MTAGIRMNGPLVASKTRAARRAIRALCGASALLVLCAATSVAVSAYLASKGSASAGPRLTSFAFHDQLGQILWRQGRFEEATTEAEIAVALAPAVTAFGNRLSAMRAAGDRDSGEC